MSRSRPALAGSLGVVVALALGAAALGVVASPEDERPAPEPIAAAPQPPEWEPCPPPEGAECATVAVPLDHDDPEGPAVALVVARLPATGDPSERIGSLFVNPGGPGASALELLPALAIVIGAEVRDRFDVVAFTPRGVDPSEPAIACSDPEQATEGPMPSDLAGWTAFFAEATALARPAATACQLSLARTGAHYGTNAVVEDLDWLRRAVGDEALTYWGISYGTRIGAVYAQRHPDRVRAMVMDGNVAPVITLPDYLLDRTGSFDDAFDLFASLHPGVAETFDAVFAALGGGPITVRDAATDEDVTLTQARFVNEVVLMRLGAESLWPAIAAELAAIEDQVQGGPTAEVSFGASTENASTVLRQVNCLDLPGHPADAALPGLAAAAAPNGPRFGPSVAAGLSLCSGFPLPLDAVPTTPPASLPPVVLLGSLHDPNTPYVWSEQMHAFLPGAALVTYEGAQHGVWNFVSDCIDDPVDAYVVDLEVPPPGIECPIAGPSAPASLVAPLAPGLPLG